MKKLRIKKLIFLHIPRSFHSTSRLSKTAGGLGEYCHSEIVVTSVLGKHYPVQKAPKSHKIWHNPTTWIQTSKKFTKPQKPIIKPPPTHIHPIISQPQRNHWPSETAILPHKAPSPPAPPRHPSTHNNPLDPTKKPNPQLQYEVIIWKKAATTKQTNTHKPQKTQDEQNQSITRQLDSSLSLHDSQKTKNLHNHHQQHLHYQGSCFFLKQTTKILTYVMASSKEEGGGGGGGRGLEKTHHQYTDSSSPPHLFSSSSSSSSSSSLL